MFDLIIKNGTVVDGTGSARFRADVAIKGDSIAGVGEITGDATREIDATGKVVTPGFIDLHTHSDNSFLIDPYADSKLTQGVTLELLGNCGTSYCAPFNANTLEEFRSYTDNFDPDYTRPTGQTWTVIYQRCRKPAQPSTSPLRSDTEPFDGPLWAWKLALQRPKK